MIRKNDGFASILGIIMAIIVLGILTAVMMPTFSSNMNYNQAKKSLQLIQAVQNAENAYMANNASNNCAFGNLTALSSGTQVYLSPSSLSGSTASEFQTTIANQTVTVCIDAGTGACPSPNETPAQGGYFIGIYNVPAQYVQYLVSGLPGSSSSGGNIMELIYPQLPSSCTGSNNGNGNNGNGNNGNGNNGNGNNGWGNGNNGWGNGNNGNGNNGWGNGNNGNGNNGNGNNGNGNNGNGNNGWGNGNHWGWGNNGNNGLGQWLGGGNGNNYGNGGN